MTREEYIKQQIEFGQTEAEAKEQLEAMRLLGFIFNDKESDKGRKLNQSQ